MGLTEEAELSQLSKGIGSAALFFYRLAGRAAQMGPIAFHLNRRGARGLEEPDRIAERYGNASADRPDGDLIWVHAASVGETNAALPIIERLVGSRYQVLLTTGTVTSAQIVATRNPPGTIHQFAPLDLPGYVSRFLQHWSPRLALFVESEIWPTKLQELERAGIPLILVNGRMSDRSLVGWRRVGPIASVLFSKISLCLAQSQADADRYAQLGVPRTEVTGNLKFDVPPPDADVADLESFAQNIGPRPAWLAASTHPGEEASILEALSQSRGTLGAESANPLLILSPRHPHRGLELAALAAELGFVVSSRSQSGPIQPNTDIYVADTIGELGLWFRLAQIAFMGGSLVPHGGQNPIEAVKLDVPVLHGPHIGNFSDIYRELDDLDGACMIESASELVKAVAAMLRDESRIAATTAAARDWLSSRQGPLDRTMQAIDTYLRSGKRKKEPADV